ncbi:MAG: BlaI/MecI/CopY family transcriptional regulator [Geodermatophilaceae bacterium]|nr:BlaI/MecI/CopY family transcriptional regulator [Geodermatophilaceae bacterium]
MRRLGELEAAIMDRLWTWRRPATVREVLDDLRQTRPIAYTTVMTVMDTLHRKELLRRERDGRAYRYEAVLSREEHSAQLMQTVLADSTDRTATLVSFFEQMSPVEATRLRKALDDAVAKRKKSPRADPE